LYELFETKIDKPLGKPFRSVASIHNDKGLWRVELAIRKTGVTEEKAAAAAAASEPAPPPTETAAAQPPR
jgi:hypothetical protein